MNDLPFWLMRMLRGERRHTTRHNAEMVQVTNRLANAELTLSRKLGTTPERLFDYKRADAILGGSRHDRH